MSVNVSDYARYQASRLEQPVETRVVLRVGGLAYNTWKSVNVSRSIAQIAGSFSFTTANRFAGDNARWGITTGDVCTIDVAGTTVLTGYIDEIDDGYSSGSHDITFSGRDKTADLVDCPFDVFSLGTSQFKNLTVYQIIEKLCDPFGVLVEADSDITSELKAEKIPVYHIEIGATTYEQIATLCQQYAVLPVTTGNGNLKLTRSGADRANDILEAGVNLKANRLNQSDVDRFSIYYTTTSGGTPKSTFNTKLISQGEFKDEYIKRFRPYIITIGDQAKSDGVAQKRAAWEARVRMGASRKVSSVVRKWTQTNDEIWPLNGIVPVKDPKIGVDGGFLIAGLNLSLDSSGGELTNLALVKPNTFLLKERVPIPNKTITDYDKRTETPTASRQLTSQELKDKLNV